jgi:mono/diheme cytochrome c family protein
MKDKKLLLLLPAILLLTACSEKPVTTNLAEKQTTAAPLSEIVYPDVAPSIPDGKLVYNQMNCAQCHSTAGVGTAKYENGKIVDLTNPLWGASKKPIEIYEMLAKGDANHKSLRSKISDNKIWDLVVYTRSFSAPALTDKEIEAIDPVFGSNCAVCHGTKGDGDGPLAHNLEPSPANFQRFNRFYDRTDAVLFDHIANGIAWEGMPNFLGKQDKTKNIKFDEAYIHKLVQYVRKFHISNASTIAEASKDQNTKKQ